MNSDVHYRVKCVSIAEVTVLFIVDFSPTIIIPSHVLKTESVNSPISLTLRKAGVVNFTFFFVKKSVYGHFQNHSI